METVTVMMGIGKKKEKALKENWFFRNEFNFVCSGHFHASGMSVQEALGFNP